MAKTSEKPTTLPPHLVALVAKMEAAAPGKLYTLAPVVTITDRTPAGYGPSEG